MCSAKADHETYEDLWEARMGFSAMQTTPPSRKSVSPDLR